MSVPAFTHHRALPQYIQTNRTWFAPTTAKEDSYLVLVSTGSGVVRFCRYPKAPAASADLELVTSIQAHTSSCTCLRLSPNGRYLATGGSDAMLNLWDTAALVCARGLDKPAGGLKSLSFSWDGNFVVAGSDEGVGIDIAHVETGEYVHRVETTIPASCVAWHPSRYWLAYAGEPGGLKIVGAAGGQL